MNYRLQIVVGNEAPFFLEEWPGGGVEISDRAIGLFEVKERGRGATLDEMLAEYGLARASFGLTELLKIGLSREWTWTSIQWAGMAALRDADIWNRIQKTLGPGLLEDQSRQLQLLKQVQAVTRRLGFPKSIEGYVTRPAGRTERIVVYASGVVAYDRTPHPLGFLQAVAAAAG